MKKRVKFGFRMSLPFGLFRNAATFVFQATEVQASKLQESVANLQGVLILMGQAEIAARLFVEAG